MAKLHRNDYPRKTKQHATNNNRQSMIANSYNCNNNERNRRFVFSTPASKLRLSSAMMILHSTDDSLIRKLPDRRDRINDINGSSGLSGKNCNFGWEARWERLRAILS